jgi:hypothetical protein
MELRMLPYGHDACDIVPNRGKANQHLLKALDK